MRRIRAVHVAVALALAVIVAAFVLTALGPLGTPRARRGVSVAGAPVGGFTEPRVRETVFRIARTMDRPPVDAHKDPVTDRIVPERPGRKIDVDATVQRVMTARAYENVPPVVESVPADVTRRALEDRFPPDYSTIGAYSTPILDRAPNRYHNIEVASRAVNNVVLPPSGGFSFRKIALAPERMPWYRPAPAIGDEGRMVNEPAGGVCQVSSTLYNAVVNEPAGGVCQVSSTLYNAVLDAGLTVTERHPHSVRVEYVAPGRDAAVSEAKDLRFVNDRPRHVIIKVEVQGGTVTARILEKRVGRAPRAG